MTWPEHLADYVRARLDETGRIAAERRQQLEQFAAWLAARRHPGHAGRAAGAIDLVFLCTQNSRRSHMGQIWAKTAAAYFGCDGVRTWSGGTEATAFAQPAVAALQRAGFTIVPEADSRNPVYRVTARAGDDPMRCWSKQFTDPANPRTDFVAVMMCAAADEACPVVPGAVHRVALPCDDPKAFDGTPREVAAYDERCAEIARELLHLFRLVAAKGNQGRHR